MAVKGGVCITHGLNVAARRGVPTEPSGEAFAPHMARLRNDAATRGASMEPSKGVLASRTTRRRNVAATMGAPTESSREACGSRIARGLNVAKARGVPNKRRRDDSVAGTTCILLPHPPPRTELHGPPIPPEDTTPGPS
jgi:hypothetical protein